MSERYNLMIWSLRKCPTYGLYDAETTRVNVGRKIGMPKKQVSVIEKIEKVTNHAERTARVIEKASKRAKREGQLLPNNDDPIAELRTLVQQHAALTRASVAIGNMTRHRKSKKTGEIIPCRLPEDVRIALIGKKKDAGDKENIHSAEGLKHRATLLQTPILRQLRKIPIYQHFLSKVYGCGPIVAAYLVTGIDIRDRTDRNGQFKALKPSSLRMYCGLAVDNATKRLVRRTAGVKNPYNAELRTRIFQMFTAMVKNAAKFPPYGKTSKYLKIWADVKHREMHSERVREGNMYRRPSGEWHKGAGAHAAKKGWHKAADIFIEDLYVVWRALEGLPVWPSYYEAKLGFAHGGDIAVNAPKSMTLDEALKKIDVASVEGQIATAPTMLDESDVPVSEDGDEEEGGGDSIAAE